MRTLWSERSVWRTDWTSRSPAFCSRAACLSRSVSLFKSAMASRNPVLIVSIWASAVSSAGFGSAWSWPLCSVGGGGVCGGFGHGAPFCVGPVGAG